MRCYNVVRLSSEQDGNVYKEDVMKVRSSVKPMRKKCKVINTKGKLRITCENPKHKHVQG